MKKITKTIIALSVLAGLASCAKEQTPVAPEVNDGMKELTLTVTQENPETRTQIGETTTGENDKKTTAVLWSEGDCLSVLDGTNNNKFTLAAGAGTATGSFTGKVDENASYVFVVYPYNDAMKLDVSSNLAVISGAEIKSEQTAKEGSFDPETALMMSVFDITSDKSFEMGNLVGYVKVTPQFDCKKITLESKSATDVLAGKLDMVYEPRRVTASNSSNKVSISGDIKAGKTYYIAALPVELSSGFKLIFTMDDNGTEKYRESSSDKVLKIVASKVKNLGTIEESQLSVVSKAVDLSESESANCYIVKEAGDYKFKAVQGNTYKKGDANKTGKSVGDDVRTVEVLWESDGTATAPAKGALIYDVSYENGYIQFTATSAQGNAVIAARDDSGVILWSWHIWCVKEKLTEQEYNNNAGTMMDRNLGATTAKAGEVGSLGLLYQWGRKDPFLGAASFSPNEDGSYPQAASTNNTAWSTSSDTMTADNTTQNPMTFYKGWENYLPDSSWSKDKTKYDPCPAGWRVPDGGSEGIWAKASGTTNKFTLSFGANGMDFSSTFGTGSTVAIWYPASGYLDNDSGVLSDVGEFGTYWSVTPDPSLSSDACYLFFNNTGDVYPSSGNGRSLGGAVRCCKE